MTNENEGKFLAFNHKGLTEELRLKATKELNETDEKRRQGLRTLREYIKEKKHLPLELNDDFLLAFLRVSKFDIKKSKERLKKYCALRRNTDMVSALDEKWLKYFMEHFLVGIMPYRNTEGSMVTFTAARAWSPEVYDMEFYAKCMFVIAHYCLSFEATTVSGVTYFVDCTVESTSYCYDFLHFFKNHFYEWLTLPIRFRRISIMHSYSIVRVLYPILRSFLPKKVKERVNFYGDCGVDEDLHPASILPNVFGGTLGPHSCEHYRDELLEFVKKMKEEDYIFKSDR